MDVHLELEDLPFPAALRAVVDDQPGPYRQVNRAFLELFALDGALEAMHGHLGDATSEFDEMSRQVIERRATVDGDLRFRGRRVTLQKSPLIRDGSVVAVLAVVTNGMAVTNSAVADPKVRDLTDHRPDVASAVASEAVVDIRDRSRSLWLEHLVDVAASPSLAAAAERAFTVAHADLHIERSVLLRFDGQAVDVVASMDDSWSARRIQIDAAASSTLRVPGVVQFPDRSVAPVLLNELGISSGAAIAITVGDRPWGTLVIGWSFPRRPLLSSFEVSMLETLASTLGMIVERNEAREMLQESNRRLEAYAHAAAHDLRSPLRRIRSFSQILQARLAIDEIDRDQLSDFAERIANGAERLDELLESMLEHASIGALAAESAEYSDLQTIARGICDDVIELSDDPKPVFVVENLPEVRLPHDAAERVLRNLIDNALKYSREGSVPEIELRGEPFDDGVRVRVSDNGIGIEPQFAAKVFGLFNQLRTEETGSGVGLAVVERLLSTRGAKIWVESGADRGAMFVIEFPRTALRPPELVR